MNIFLKEYRIYIIAIILILLAVVIYKIWHNNKLGNFAECVAQKAEFYGASWCPNCMAQKKLFGKAASKLNYIECSVDPKQSQIDVCVDLKIRRYPTWIFEDDSKVEGVMYLDSLAKKTGCTY